MSDFDKWYAENGYYHDTVSDRKELMRDAWNAARSPARESGDRKVGCTIEDAFKAGKEVGEIGGKVAVEALETVRYERDKLELAYRQLLTESKCESGVSPSITVGEYVITVPYSGKPEHIAIYRDGGEGGDFNRAKLEEVLAQFYRENF